MDYEKKYKEALERAYVIYTTWKNKPDVAAVIKQALEKIFPKELEEISYERIRKELLKHLQEGAEGYEPAGGAEDYSRWLAWLEKQGEQKPLWSEEDEHRIEDIIYYLDTAKKHYASTVGLYACIAWLKSIKKRRVI